MWAGVARINMISIGYQTLHPRAVAPPAGWDVRPQCNLQETTSGRVRPGGRKGEKSAGTGQGASAFEGLPVVSFMIWLVNRRTLSHP